MLHTLDPLRELNTLSLLLRLTLAMLCGGLIGMDRERKHRPAGFRTYMLVCIGAALTMLLGQYHWYLSAQHGTTTDAARFGAQVVNGIGFLGAGTVLVTGRQEVKGLTTAAGLWASACMGLAIGAGFYECVALAFLLIFLAVRFLPLAETYLVENSRNMNIYVEFRSLDDLGTIISCLKAHEVHIYEVDIDRGRSAPDQRPSAIFFVRLRQRQSHTGLLADLSVLETIHVIDEI